MTGASVLELLRRILIMKYKTKEFCNIIRETLKDGYLIHKPKVATILVGDSEESKSYISKKMNEISNLNGEHELISMDKDVSTLDVINKIKELTIDDSVTGIIVQLPLPKHINTERVLQCIPVHKDVDGFSDHWNMQTFRNNEIITPCTPQGIIELLEYEYKSLEGYRVLVIGRGQTVGKPIMQMLSNRNATVLQLHSKTKESIKDHILAFNPDIIISAVGADGIIKYEDVCNIENLKFIIDCGIKRKDGKSRGDILKEDYPKFDESKIKYTPVIGGIGPVTCIMLAKNLLKLSRIIHS